MFISKHSPVHRLSVAALGAVVAVSVRVDQPGELHVRRAPVLRLSAEGEVPCRKAMRETSKHPRTEARTVRVVPDPRVKAQAHKAIRHEAYTTTGLLVASGGLNLECCSEHHEIRGRESRG
ncbi:unnamed protein product [Mycena citricolor]|uniref:Uncharacterized protein n=1 Tax=Mycena citricolor TaxID=2018698 RepID=A0AAD2Q3M0_9AGAR|nr:unnamed protein product [Mycena citricolor]